MELENMLKSVLALISLMFSSCIIYIILKKDNKDYIDEHTFKNYEIVTINNDTIRGNFFLQRESSFFNEIPGYYILLSDSTRYNEEKIVSIKKKNK